MDLAQERLSILRAAAEQRRRDEMIYQINIDNFTLALAEIGGSEDPDLVVFAKELRERLAGEKAQQARESILLKVIERQLACSTSS